MSQRRITLIRHAEAALGGGPDARRPLTPRGREQAGELARKLTHLACPEWIVHSRARRAAETASALAQSCPKAVLTSDEGIYDAWVDDLIDLIRLTPGQVRSLAIVGHAPTIGATVETLGACTVGATPTASAYLLECVGEWEDVSAGACTLVATVGADSSIEAPIRSAPRVRDSHCSTGPHPPRAR